MSPDFCQFSPFVSLFGLRKILAAFLISSSLLACSAPVAQLGPFQTQSESAGVVADYLLKVSESFGIKAVEPAHQSAVDAQIKGFETDLASGSVDAYYQNPGFSILLAAGSEGNFFNSKEGIEVIGKSGAVFARAMVFDPDAEPKIFKGQYSNGRFYFSGGNQAVFSPLNQTYLITLDLNLDTKVYKGQLVAGSEGNFIRPGTGLPAELAAGSEGNFLRAPDSTALATQLEKYRSALDRNATEGASFARKVSELKFTPPAFPLGLAWTETFARLVRAYPDEMRFSLGRIRGLPRTQLDIAWRQVMERYIARWTSECGSPPPDQGKIWPQKLGEVYPVPQGWQTEALDKVVADIPAFAAELQALMKITGPQRGTEFLRLLAKYRASHAEVFARHAWRDEFAPPACVKPRIQAAGPPPGSPPGPPRASLPGPGPGSGGPPR